MTLHKRNELKKTINYKKFLKKIERKKNKLKKPLEESIFITTPDNFNISENPKEMIEFFEMLEEKVLKIKEKTYVVIDMKNLKFINADGLMYLLLFKKKVNKSKVKLRIKVPKNDILKRYLISSGFISDIEKNKEDNYFKIHSGNGDNKIDVSKKICEFVQNKFLLQRKQTMDLYGMCIELMLNTIQHAFNLSYNDEKKWYIFADAKNVNEGIISFVFLDTGVGIPTTVNKKWIEKLSNKINKIADSQFLLSALNGELRSETGLSYRNKGLTDVYNLFLDKKIRGLKIISNKAYFKMGDISDLENSFEGTLFYWEINKEDLSNEKI